MENNIRRRGIAVAMVSLLLAVPLLVSAQDSNGRFGRQIVDRVFARLCAVGALRSARCEPPAPPAPILTLVKTVINDNGGTATATSFQVKIDDTVVAWGTPYNVSVGTHMASEMTHSNYTASAWGGDCAADGSITLAAGETKTCTITNDDNAPAPEPGLLIVDKITQPVGHTKVFDIMAIGTGVIEGGGAGTTTDAVSKEYTVTAGTYSVTETVPAGWTQVSNTCTNVVVAEGETETCTITNRKEPKITVMKVVMNDSGGTATSSDFTIHVHDMSGTTTVDVAGSPQPGSAAGTSYTVVPGIYHVEETGGPSNYTMSVSGDCAADGSITLSAGDNKTCTVTNDDNPPVVTGKLLVTEVLYDLSSAEGDPQGVEPGNEWVEIYNGMNVAVDLSGYTLNDAFSADAIPDGTMLAVGKYLVVTGSTTTASFWSIPGDAVVVVISDNIGNGLANAGDMVELKNASGTSLDTVSWGTNTTAFSPSVPVALDGYSIVRMSNTTDTDTAADWTQDLTPGPGSTN